MLSKIQSDPFLMGYGGFGLADFFKKSSWILKGTYLYIVWHIRLNIGSVSPSFVNLSFRPTECAILFWTVPGSVPGLFFLFYQKSGRIIIKKFEGRKKGLFYSTKKIKVFFLFRQNILQTLDGGGVQKSVSRKFPLF